MAVTVRPHNHMRDAFRRYALSLPGGPAERARLAKARWDEFVASIVAAGGPPEGAIADPRFPGSYWCPFPGGLLVLVHFPPPRRTGWFRSVVEAVAVEMNLSPGSPD